MLLKLGIASGAGSGMMEELHCSEVNSYHMTTTEEASVLPPVAPGELDARPAEIDLPPSALYGEAFHDIALAELDIFRDGIDLADSVWKLPPEEIRQRYAELKAQPDFSREHIKAFAMQYIQPPIRTTVEHERRRDLNLLQYCHHVILKSARTPYRTIGTQIGLEEESLSPGGRFDTPGEGLGRVYNWDFWPVARALARFPGKLRARGLQLYRSGLNNTVSLIKRTGGNNPNGNSTYFQYRSQPNIFPGAVRHFAEATGDEEDLLEYLESIEAHHQYWREGADDPEKLGAAAGKQYRRVVRMPEFEVAYRNYDDGVDHGLGPRDEMYAQDVKEFKAFDDYQLKTLGRRATPEERRKFFLDKRAGAEQGEDYTGAVYKDGVNPETIHTTDLVPVKINALMCDSARTLAYGFRLKAARATDPDEIAEYTRKADEYEREGNELAAIIEKYCVVEEENGDVWLADYDLVAGEQKPAKSLSAVFALSRGIIRPELAGRMLETMERKFLRDSGFINSLYETNEQWDKAVWPIMQMEAVDAAKRYGRYDLAYKWSKIFINTCEKMYDVEGYLCEKFDPDHPGQAGGGGEYDCVKDLLMTIGTYIEMKAMNQELKWLARKQRVRTFLSVALSGLRRQVEDRLNVTVGDTLQ